MPLQLRDNLHWCDCDGRAVFLDTQADLYFCLPKAANDAFLRLAAEDMEPGDRERLSMLLQRGMLIDTNDRARLRAPARIEPPTRDFLEEPVQVPDLLSVVGALASELRAALALRIKGFHGVMETVRSRGAVNTNSGRDRLLEEILAGFAAAAIVTRSHDRCLVRALAVHSACCSGGISAKLVFGVIAHPFTAHCWVQLGNAVLVGGYERARLHTPILVLG